jgi:dimethylargininase
MGTPDFDTALEQHHAYVEALKACGLVVIVLPADDRFPDSVFVEDTALLTPRCAILAYPGAKSRRGEIEIIRETIANFYPAVETIEPPGTVDAGDVMMVGNDFYIGLSERTNEEGADQMVGLLRYDGMNGIPISIHSSKKYRGSHHGSNLQRAGSGVGGEYEKYFEDARHRVPHH